MTTPSFVSFNNTGRLIGEGAKNQIAMNPTNTVFVLIAIDGSEDPYRFFNWRITYGDIYPLGVRQQGILINGHFPGPDIYCVTNDNLIINVFNNLDEPFLISWFFAVSTNVTVGQAYEAMNNAGFLDSNLIVVLNDNKQVSLPTATLDGPATPVGALSSALAKLQANTEFRKLREAVKSITKQIGPQAHEVAAKVDEYARGMISASGLTLFEELGLYYIGPVDGHNVEDLVSIFEKVKSMPAPGLVLIHIVTEKGKGYPPAEAAADKMHAIRCRTNQKIRQRA